MPIEAELPGAVEIQPVDALDLAPLPIGPRVLGAGDGGRIIS